MSCDTDRVVCVGGDGMFSEIIHGLISRTQADCGVDQNCAEEKLVPCRVRIGIIPAGSTDCICYATVGINDPVTSALHIIVGDSQALDVCSVHHNNTFLRYSVSLLGYGFYGDVLKDSEKKRWMGPARYDFSDILGTPRDKTKCRAGCYICQHNGQLLSEDAQFYRMEDNISHSVKVHIFQGRLQSPPIPHLSQSLAFPSILMLSQMARDSPPDQRQGNACFHQTPHVTLSLSLSDRSGDLGESVTRAR
ncbi:hypothetical protein JZ751_024094 [Albula glossodonta]|uniref:DAGKc domain-containing protein n=1 Tax=Albula glossodonta TaxID=121402 RepID=A0A8T2NH63_9TELE|nr:hypothetical protein JZ751_024094 [Albula glossodonta]